MSSAKQLHNMTAEELDARSRTATTRKKIKWICFECAKTVEVSLNVGQPEYRYCDKCQREHRCYEVL